MTTGPTRMIEMIKTITIDTDKWRVVPREPSEEMIKAGKDVFCDPSDHSEEAASNDYRNVFKGMIAAAPQPEPVESEPVCEWVKADGANYIHPKWHKYYVAVEGDKLYTTPQPDRTAELETALSKFKDALFDVLIQDMSRDKALAKINEVLK